MKREWSVKYYEDDPSHGVIFDWQKVFKAYRSLGCPEEYFDPTTRPVDTAKYLTVFSRRATGKTTGILLLGLVLHEMYGTLPVYIRQMPDMIAPKNTKSMMDVIIGSGYIPKLTDGRWNSAFYYRRYWYYCNYDETGAMTEKGSEPICFMADVSEYNTYKSGWASQCADYLIYDEFVNPAYLPDEFIQFLQLVSTIGRERYSPVIWLISNNTDKESPFFYEMECNEIVRYLDKNCGQLYKTKKGTQCYIEWYAPEVANKKSKKVLEKLTTLFYGFQNKKLGSITGEDWAIEPAQRIPKYFETECEFVWRNVYIYFHERYVTLDLVVHPVMGVCLLARWATKVYDDSMILTCENRFDPRYHYGLGSKRMSAIITKCFAENRVYYASNDVKAFLTTYLEHYSDHRFA